MRFSPLAALLVLVSTATAEEPTTAVGEDLVLCRIDGGPLMVVDVPPEGCVVEKRKGRRAAPVSTGDPSASAAGTGPRAPLPIVRAPISGPEGPAGEGLLDLGSEIESRAERALFDADARDHRRRLERRANEVRGELESLHERIRSLLDESRDRLRESRPGLEAYADALRRRDAEVTRLRARELEVLDDWRSVEREFELLSARVHRAHGGEPPEDWPPVLACEKCP